jgi:ADP-ribose pyrophosphatase YjhB (NUDIX family)
MPLIEPTVLGVLARDDEFLLHELTAPTGEPCYRPVGGTIEFGESSADALVREFREELGIEVDAGTPLGTIEDRFQWDGQQRHKLVIFRSAAFSDPSNYERERFENTDGRELQAVWKSLSEIQAEDAPLYTQQNECRIAPTPRTTNQPGCCSVPVPPFDSVRPSCLASRYCSRETE